MNKALKLAAAGILSVFVALQADERPANAQINIQIGVSTADATRVMLNNGFSQIQIYEKGFKSVRAKACKDGIQYRVQVDRRKRIKSAVEIGSCRNEVTVAQVQRNLKANGYSRVLIDEQNGNYVAIGCKDGRRTRIVLTRQGQVKQRRNIGRCEEALQPTDVAELLRRQGYNRIFFTDRQLPRYVAEACLKNRRSELVLNRFGEIRSEKRIGRCDPPIDPRNLARVLEDKGYDRVEIIDAELPRYQAEACQNNQRFNVVLNRFGEVIDRSSIGKCRSSLDRKEIANILANEGFTRINVKENSRGGFNITACLDGRQKIVRLTRYGELAEENDGGLCESRSVREVSENLQGRGLKKLEFYAEGCRNGRKIRIQLNEFGDRIGRERIGNC